MDQTEFYARHDEAVKNSGAVAAQKVLEMNLPKIIDLPTRVTVLGEKIGKEAQRLQDGLEEKHGEKFPKLMAVALHEYWFACWQSASYIGLCIENGAMNDNEYTQRLTIAQEYADFDGWASTLANGFADITPSVERKNCIKQLLDEDILDISTALRCMSLFWFHRASAEHAEGSTESAFNFLHEAFAALCIDRAHSTWDDAWGDGINSAQEISASKVRVELAKKAAYAAHAETRSLKDEVKKYWIASVSSSLGNDDAAAILIRQFPLKFRTLSGYVSEFKNTVN